MNRRDSIKWLACLAAVGLVPAPTMIGVGSPPTTGVFLVYRGLDEMGREFTERIPLVAKAASGGYAVNIDELPFSTHLCINWTVENHTGEVIDISWREIL